MKRIALAMIVVLGIATIASADCRRVVQVHNAVVVQQVAAVAAFVPVVSVFSVGPAYAQPLTYAPQAAAQVAAAPAPINVTNTNTNTNSDIKPVLDQILARLKALETTTAPPSVTVDPVADPVPGPIVVQEKKVEAPKAVAQKPVDPNAPPSPLLVMQKNCAKCHDASVAANKGKGIALLNGNNLIDVDDATRAALMTSIYDGDMPKGGDPLSDLEIAVIMKQYKKPLSVKK